MRDAVADRVGGSVPVLLTPYGGPEAPFRLGRIEAGSLGGLVDDDPHGVRVEQPVPDGRPCALAPVTLRALSLG